MSHICCSVWFWMSPFSLCLSGIPHYILFYSSAFLLCSSVSTSALSALGGDLRLHLPLCVLLHLASISWISDLCQYGRSDSLFDGLVIPMLPCGSLCVGIHCLQLSICWTSKDLQTFHHSRSFPQFHGYPWPPHILCCLILFLHWNLPWVWLRLSPSSCPGLFVVCCKSPLLFLHLYNLLEHSTVLAEQQPVGRWARTRKYETPRTMKTIGNCP